MPPLLTFAQQSAAGFSAGQLGTALAIASFLVALAVGVKKLFGHEPPLHKEYASRTDADFLKSEIGKLDTERRTSVANLHSKVDAQVAALRAELTAKVEKLEGRIDAVPERTIKLLRETKGLI